MGRIHLIRDNLGVSLRARGYYDLALATFEEAIKEMDAAGDAPASESRILALRNRLDCLVKLDRTEETLTRIDELLDLLKPLRPKRWKETIDLWKERRLKMRKELKASEKEKEKKEPEPESGEKERPPTASASASSYDSSVIPPVLFTSSMRGRSPARRSMP